MARNVEVKLLTVAGRNACRRFVGGRLSVRAQCGYRTVPYVWRWAELLGSTTSVLAQDRPPERVPFKLESSPPISICPSRPLFRWNKDQSAEGEAEWQRYAGRDKGGNALANSQAAYCKIQHGGARGVADQVHQWKQGKLYP